MTHFRYLSTSAQYVIDGVSDAKKFNAFREARPAPPRPRPALRS
jgi:hypothetical protein